MRLRMCQIVFVLSLLFFALQSVYGVVDDTQTQSPVHTPSQQSNKDTREDVEKEVCVLVWIRFLTVLQRDG